MNQFAYLNKLNKLTHLPDMNSDKLERVAAIIHDYVKEVYDIDLIVVGGLSVEIYTEGGYTTQDIDFVGVNHEKIMQALGDLGFERIGKDSVHEKLKVFVEVPGSVLKDAEEKYVKVKDTVDGHTLKIIGIEDIIKDRLTALVQWKEYHQDQWIYQLIQRYRNELDVVYIRETLGDQEREYFDYFYELVKEVDATEKWQFELTLFLDDINMPYSIYKMGSFEIIALPTGKNSYYGLTLSPLIMGYNYEEDDIEGNDTFIAIDENELTLDELIKWLSNISDKIINLNKMINYLNKLNQ